MQTITEQSIAQKVALLSYPNKPLFSHKHKLGVFFSAKSGCTFAMKWYFFQTDLLEAAMSYKWMHRYRLEIFYERPEYKENLHKILNPDNNILKFVRDPYSRAVSSYIHAAKFGYENKLISAFLKRPVNPKRGFSFSEFVLYLGSIDLQKCNIHHQLQVSKAEVDKVLNLDFVIKIENSSESLRVAEESLGLKRSNSSQFRQSIHHTERSTDAEFSGNRIFTTHELKGNPKGRTVVPPADCFYNPFLRDRVKDLYWLDFTTYGYDTNLDS